MTCVDPSVRALRVLPLPLALVLIAAGCGAGGATCGDGEVAGAEACDDGNAVAADGCEVDCSFSCVADAACDDGEACNGAEVCADHACAAGEPLADRTACGDEHICVDGACVASVCPNGELEAGEDCDDGGVAALDGCDAECRYEVVFRTYSRVLQYSPAASFCAQPSSALGDALSGIALASTNSITQSQINRALVNGLLQIVELDDPTGLSDGTFAIRLGDGITDPAGGEWPIGSSNPIDWPFLVVADSTQAGEIADRIDSISLQDGTFVGGPGSSTRAVPALQDATIRGRLLLDPPADAPQPPDGLASSLRVVREILSDGNDEGICGNLTVDALSRIPVDDSLTGCLECPGDEPGTFDSHTYTACPGDEVTPECNSLLDATVGGCILFDECSHGNAVLFPTQPDVDKPGGVAVLVNDVDDHNKVPLADTLGNIDGFSVYYKFKARRVRLTGVAD